MLTPNEITPELYEKLARILIEGDPDLQKNQEELDEYTEEVLWQHPE